MLSVRRAVRRLNRRRGFAAAVIVCWSLGIAAAVSTFWVADSVFFRPPLGVGQSARVIRLYTEVTEETAGTQIETDRYTYGDFLAVRSAVGKAATIAAYGLVSGTLSAGTLIQPVTIGVVTSDFFPLVRTHADRGRLLGPVDTGAVRAAAFPVVLSAAMARTAFGNAALAVGKTVWLRGIAFAVVGIAPDGFTAGDPKAIDAWVLTNPGGEWGAGPNWPREQTWWLRLIARLAPGVSAAQVEARASVALTRGGSVGPSERLRKRVIAASVLPGRGPMQSPVTQAARWLTAGGALLLLIASANVAVLFVLRGIERESDVAVQRALGAPVQALTLDLVSELGVLAVVAGFAAAGIAGLLQQVTTAALLPGTPVPETIFSGRALLLLGAGVGVSALGAGVGPTTIALRRNLTAFTTDFHTTSGRRTRRLRLGVTMLQVFAATLLFSGALALTTTLRALQSLSLGLIPDHVVLVTTSREYARTHIAIVTKTFATLHARARALPVVEAVSTVAEPPLVEAAGMSINTPDHPQPIELPTTGTPYFNLVDPAYFGVIGTRILRGRDFTGADKAGTPAVMIVNETLARVAWPGQDPLRHCLVLGAEPGGACVPIVGIAENARLFTIVPEPPIMQIYLPEAQEPQVGDLAISTLLLRVRGDPARALPTVARLVRIVVPPSMPVTVQSLGAVIEPQIRPWRASSHLFILYGGVALILTSVGVGGALLHDVRQRRRELAIRLALGGSRSRVFAGVVRVTLACTALSGAAAALVAWWLLRRWAAVAFAWAGHEGTFVLEAAGLVVVSGVIAASVPAWKAAGLAVADVLRD